MNSQFQETYLRLLRRQVDEEISYLVQNGHDNNKIYVPCMFCVQHKNGYYQCHRLNELRQFQSIIICNQTSKLRPEPRYERKKIGFPVESVNTGAITPIQNHASLPPMFPDL